MCSRSPVAVCGAHEPGRWCHPRRPSQGSPARRTPTLIYHGPEGVAEGTEKHGTKFRPRETYPHDGNQNRGTRDRASGWREGRRRRRLESEAAAIRGGFLEAARPARGPERRGSGERRRHSRGEAQQGQSALRTPAATAVAGCPRLGSTLRPRRGWSGHGRHQRVGLTSLTRGSSFQIRLGEGGCRFPIVSPAPGT